MALSPKSLGGWGWGGIKTNALTEHAEPLLEIPENRTVNTVYGTKIGNSR